MNTTKIIDFVKRHQFIYFCYFWLMSAFVNILKILVRTDDKLILFVVYGGKSYCDSPRCLYEAMLTDNRFNGYRLVWAFRKPEDYPEIPLKIKIDTLSYYLTALKSRCWVTNESVTRALKFKGKKTFYFFTTHTALPKDNGKDLKRGTTFTSIRGVKYDCTCAQSEEEKQIQLRKYDLKDNQVLVCGYPKNDRIANHTESDVHIIREKLRIPDGKKVILYAPTKREEKKKQTLNFCNWAKELQEKYILLYRAHHSMVDKTRIEDISNFVIDVGSYPDNSDLLIVADVLISDYSGIFFEFGVQEKPMFCFAYDYEEYLSRRGLYVDIPNLLPGGSMSEKRFLNYFKTCNHDDVMEKVNKFRNKYISVYGNATSICLDTIYTNI